MSWETPKVVEIRMDAEVGSYQEDFGGEKDPRIASDTVAASGRGCFSMHVRLASPLLFAALATGCSASPVETSASASLDAASSSAASEAAGGGSNSPPVGNGGSGGASTSGSSMDSGPGTNDDANADAGTVTPRSDGAIDAIAPAKDFVCTQVIGLVLTSEWYLAGFENGVDNARWQLKWAEHSYVDEWAKPDSPFWATPLVSPCADHSTAPDRVVFVALSWMLMAEKEWETPLAAVVANIKTKYPSVRAIDLLTIIRGPGNKACDPNPNATESTKIPAGLDDTITRVAAQNPGFVSAGPKVEASSCSDFNGVGPHLTSAGNMKMAQLYAAYYAKAP